MKKISFSGLKPASTSEFTRDGLRRNRTFSVINRREGGAFVRDEARSEDDGVARGELRRGRTTQPQSEQMSSLPTRDYGRGSKAQVSLELIGSLLVCLILIVGITRVFVWLNQCLVNRQYEYQDTRKPMRDSSDVVEDFYTPEDLSVVRE